jgi:hypothetical protein
MLDDEVSVACWIRQGNSVEPLGTADCSAIRHWLFVAMAENDSALGAIGRQSILILRSPALIRRRDCEILDQTGKRIGFLVQVEGKRLPSGFGMAVLRGQTFEIRDQNNRCLGRIEGPGTSHKSGLIVTDPHGTEAGTIKRPDALGVFGRLLFALGLEGYAVEAGGQRLGLMNSEGGRIDDLSGEQVVRIWVHSRLLSGRTDCTIKLKQPLHETFPVLAIAAAIYRISRNISRLNPA